MMKKIVLIIVAAVNIASASAQSPEITSWMLNTTGHQADYEFYPGPPPTTNSVQMTDSSDVKTVCYNTTDVYVRAEGLANYTMGPFLMNPNVPSAQGYTFKFTRTPTEETGTKTVTPFGGSIGVAINGAVFFGYGDGTSYSFASNSNIGGGDGNWDADAWVSEGTTMDATGAGHPTNGGVYHYHATPIALYTDPSPSHSPIIGYAYDGFPIYGPFGYTSPTNSSSGISRMRSGYELRNITVRTQLPDGSTSTPPGPAVDGTFPLGTYVQDYEFTNAGTLDEYNGRYCVTPEYPGGTYAYFISTDINGDPEFPYLLGAEYYGVVSSAEITTQGSITTPGGLTCWDGTISSIDEETATQLTIYPNPSSLSATIISEVLNDEISIISSEGKTMETWTPTTLQAEIDLSAYPNGLYFVRVVKDDVVRTFTLQVLR